MTRQTSILLGVLAVAVLAVWWMFLMTPPREEIAQLEADTAAAENEADALEAQILALESVRARSVEIEAQIAVLRQVIPDDEQLPAALRQLQAAADDAGLLISTASVSRPEPVEGTEGLYTMPLTLTVTGSYFQVVDLLRRIEDPTIVSRGVVVEQMTMTPVEHPTLNVSISARMFAVLDAPPSPADVTGQAQTSAPAADTTTAESDAAPEGDQPLNDEEQVS